MIFHFQPDIFRLPAAAAFSQRCAFSLCRRLSLFSA
jgi:hypothetical protein